MKSRGRLAGGCIPLIAAIALLALVASGLQATISGRNGWQPAGVSPRATATSACLNDEQPADITASAMPTTQSEWHQSVARSVARARELLGKNRGSHKRRVLIPLLSSHHSRLCCFIANLQDNVFPKTAVDVFVFSIDNAAEGAVAKACPDRLLANLFFLPLDEHWVTPQAAGSSVDWAVAEDFSEEYRRMGHWRLTFQYAFADALGYPYVWQTDDDSHFNATVPFDTIQFMQQHNLLVAAHEVTSDPNSVIWGLPELTRYFLLAEAMEPETLFNNCNPPSLEGLFVATSIDPMRGWEPDAEEKAQAEEEDKIEGEGIYFKKRKQRRRLRKQERRRRMLAATTSNAVRKGEAIAHRAWDEQLYSHETLPKTRVTDKGMNALQHGRSKPVQAFPSAELPRDQDEDEELAGWNGSVLYGNCVVVDVRFWFRPQIQKYLCLVLGTAGHFRFRWNEQAVLGMVWQIFVPPEQFRELPIEYYHPAECNAKCKCWEDV